MTSLDKKLKQAITKVINDYQPKKGTVPVYDEMSVEIRDQFPFFTYYLYDEGQTVEFEKVNNEVLNVGVQIKGLSNNQEEAAQMARFLRDYFRTRGVYEELLKSSITLTDVNFLPNINVPLETNYVFERGVDLRLNVRADFEDKTQMWPKPFIKKINKET